MLELTPRQWKRPRLDSRARGRLNRASERGPLVCLVSLSLFAQDGAPYSSSSNVGVLQVGGVEAFAEPAVDRSEHGARFVGRLVSRSRRARLIVARNSSDRASCDRATSRALPKSASAQLGWQISVRLAAERAPLPRHVRRCARRKLTLQREPRQPQCRSPQMHASANNPRNMDNPVFSSLFARSRRILFTPSGSGSVRSEEALHQHTVPYVLRKLRDLRKELQWPLPDRSRCRTHGERYRGIGYSKLRQLC